jgi:hypothetical protein
MKFFNGWHLFNIAGNIFQISASMMLLLLDATKKTGEKDSMVDVTLGIAALFSWIQII